MVLWSFERRVTRIHSGEYLSQEKHIVIGRGFSRVNVSWSPDLAIADAAKDRMSRLSRREDCASAFLPVRSMMRNPGFAEKLPSEATADIFPMP
jgi:hypothetical protein